MARSIILASALLIILSLIFISGCTSNEYHNQTVVTEETQTTPLMTTQPSLTPTQTTSLETTAIKTSVATTRETTTIQTTEPLLPQTTTTNVVAQLQKDQTPTNYMRGTNWKSLKSDSNDFEIWYPNNKWFIYEITGGEQRYRMNKGYSLCYPYPAKSQYGKLKSVIEDADYVIDIYGYVFYENNKENADIIKSYLRGVLDYYGATEITEYRDTGKINGNNATHFTYILTHVNTKTIGDAYIIQRGYKYYIVAYVGGKVQSADYDRVIILRILQSFEPT